jgi:hypothetical protein
LSSIPDLEKSKPRSSILKVLFGIQQTKFPRSLAELLAFCSDFPIPALCHRPTMRKDSSFHNVCIYACFAIESWSLHVRYLEAMNISAIHVTRLQKHENPETR